MYSWWYSIEVTTVALRDSLGVAIVFEPLASCDRFRRPFRGQNQQRLQLHSLKSPIRRSTQLSIHTCGSWPSQTSHETNIGDPF
jgi:hypothetical protein